MTKTNMPDPTSDGDAEIDDLAGRIESCDITNGQGKAERRAQDKGEESELVKEIKKLTIGQPKTAGDGCPEEKEESEKNEVKESKKSKDEGKQEEKTNSGERKDSIPMMKLDAPDLQLDESEDEDEESAEKIKKRGPSFGVATSYQYGQGQMYDSHGQNACNISMPANFPDYSNHYQNNLSQNISAGHPSKRVMDLPEMSQEPPKYVRPQVNDLNAEDHLNGQKKSIVYIKQMSGGTVYTGDQSEIPPQHLTSDHMIGKPQTLPRTNSLGLGSLTGLNIPPGSDSGEFNIDDFLPEDNTEQIQPSNAQPKVTYPQHMTPTDPYITGQGHQQANIQQTFSQYTQAEVSPVMYPTTLTNQRSPGGFEDYGYESDLSPQGRDIPVPSPESQAHSPPYNQSPPCVTYSPPPSNMSSDSGTEQDDGHHPYIDKYPHQLKDALDFVEKEVFNWVKQEELKKKTESVKPSSSPTVNGQINQRPFNPAQINQLNQAQMIQSNQAQMIQSNQALMTQSNQALMTQSNQVLMTPSNQAQITPSVQALMTPSNQAQITPSNQAQMTQLSQAMKQAQLSQAQFIPGNQTYHQTVVTNGTYTQAVSPVNPQVNPVHQTPSLLQQVSQSVSVTKAANPSKAMRSPTVDAPVRRDDGKIAISRLPSTETRPVASNIVMFVPTKQPQLPKVPTYVPIKPKISSPTQPQQVAAPRNSPAISRQPEMASKLENMARRLVAEMTKDEICHIDGDGDTYLHIAIPDGNIEHHMVQALMERLERESMTSMFDQQNGRGETPLYLAVQVNSPEKVNCLIKKNANPNILADRVHASGRVEKLAAIHYAASYGTLYLPTLMVLLTSKHIDVNQVNSDGHSALNLAILAHGRNTPKGVIDSIPTIEALLRANADPNKQMSQNGKTALMLVLESGNLDLIEKTFDLIKKIVNPAKLLEYLKTQSFQGNTCEKLASHLARNMSIHNQQRLHAALRPIRPSPRATPTPPNMAQCTLHLS